jgi:hypothetical protein
MHAEVRDITQDKGGVAVIFWQNNERLQRWGKSQGIFIGTAYIVMGTTRVVKGTNPKFCTQ